MTNVKIGNQNFEEISKIYLNEGGKLSYGNNKKTIDLLDCIGDRGNASFTLIMYIDNLNYDNQYDNINKLPIEEEDAEKLLEQIQKVNISIDNIYIDSKYVDENQWNNIDKFYQWYQITNNFIHNNTMNLSVNAAEGAEKLISMINETEKQFIETLKEIIKKRTIELM